ncbi:MAG: ABC transporter substrate-binding protein [Chloroflexi bacterium]|nr:ABC transporter substrate-binding protein [Chloroflexota bacterium]
MKRIILSLSLLIIVGVFVAACAAPAAQTVEVEVEKVVTVEVAAPVDIVDVTYTYPGPIPEDVPLVQDAMNEILNEKIGVNLILENIDWGAYNDKMQLRLAAGEECDIIFTAPWINSYANNVSNGNLIPLDGLLLEDAPGLWASMPASTWDAARVKGKIYGVINQQIFPKPWGIHPRKDLAEKYELDIDAVEKWEDVEPWLAAVRDGEGITPVYINMEGATSSTPGLWRSQYYGYDPLDDGIGAIVMKADDPDRIVVSTLELPAFIEASDLAAHWIEEGFLPLEPSFKDEGDAAFRAGLYAMAYHVEKPGNEIEAQNAFGFEFLRKNLTNPLILDTAGATATLNGICATSRHPAEAMKVLEEFNTNPDIYNLLSRGIEGVHWVWADEANKVIGYPEGVDGSTSTYNPNTDWMFGNQFNAYYRDAAQVGAWEETLEMNNTAMPSTALGFTVDRKPIETEIAQVNAVWAEYGVPIGNGWIPVDGNADEGIQKLKEAGLDTIIAEVQRQIDEWAVLNNK